MIDLRLGDCPKLLKKLDQNNPSGKKIIMRTITIEYSAIGCDDSCVYRLPMIQQSKVVQDEDGLDCVFTETIPQCSRIAEVALRRQSIYDAANKAADEAWDRCQSFHGKLRARTQAFRRVADQYANEPCPYFSGEGENR